MMALSKKVIAVVLMIVASHGYAGDTAHHSFKAVYVDKQNNVHIVLHDGRDKKISRSGNAASEPWHQTNVLRHGWCAMPGLRQAMPD